jgi:hypothetical protein
MKFFYRSKSGKRTRRSRQRGAYRLLIECLEQRAVPSVTISGGIATVTGTDGPDQFIIRLKAGDPATVQMSDDNGAHFTDAPRASLSEIDVNGLGGQDQLTLDNTNGLVGNPGEGFGLQINYDGGTGYNTVVIEGTGLANVNEIYSDVPTLLPPSDSGVLFATQPSAMFTFRYFHVSNVFDTMTAISMTVNAGPKNNAISIGYGTTPLGSLTTNTIDGVDFRRLNDDGSFHASDPLTGDPSPDQGDNTDHGHGEDRPFEVQASRGFVPITYANKANVAIDAAAGDDFFNLAVHNAATGEQSLLLNGGSGFNVLATTAFSSSVPLTVQNIQTVVTDRDSVFIESLFEERLARPAQNAELAAWRQLLASEGAAAVVVSVDQSLEARTLFVRDQYERYLNRDPLNGEDQAWINGLRSGALSEEAVIQGFLASTEFINRAQSIIASGDSDHRWVTALYQMALGRSASDAEVQAWVNALPALGRSGVAAGFVESAEFRANYVGSIYVDVLRRIASDSEVNAWVNSGLSLEEIRDSILSSNEAISAR